MTDYEQALVFAAKNGNEKSFEELYKIYYQKVYSLAKMTLKNEADAEDALQLTFVSAWKNISSLEDNAAFNSWIQRITLNQCYALLRTSRPVVSIDDDESDEHGITELESDLMLPEVYAQKEDLRTRLGKIINSLSEVQRQTIQLYYFDELSVDEIADTMECSTGTVKSRLFLARKAIRTEIEETERKTGQKFYGVVGIPLLAFSQLFKQQAEAAYLSTADASSVFSEVCRNLNFHLNTSSAAFQSSVASEVKTVAEDAGEKVVSAARTAAEAAKKTASTVASGAAKKATTGLITRIVAGVLSAAMIVGGGAGMVTEVQAQTPTFELPAETERIDYYNRDPGDAETNADYSAAYRAFLDILKKERNRIVTYDWQNQDYGFSEQEIDNDIPDEPAPIAFADICGDNTPEMIFIETSGDALDGRYYCTTINIVSFRDGGVKTLYSEPWDYMVGGGFHYALFQLNGDKALYARASEGDEWHSDTYFRFSENGDGTLFKEEVLKYDAHPDEVINNTMLYKYTWTQGGVEINEEEYTGLENQMIGKINAFLIRSRFYTPVLYEKIRDLGTMEMTYDEAIAYLNSLLGIKDDLNVTDEEVFSMIEGIQFSFASGVGAWGTEIKIASDGSFVGDYHDTDMGDTGENYPNGTVYLSKFHGKFRNAKKLNDYTFSFELDELVYDEPFEDSYENGVRYIIESAYGLESGKKYMLYLPKSIVKNLPEEFVNWVSMPMAWSSYNKPILLPFYGIYNVEKEYGFFSSEAPYPKKYDSWNDAYEDFIFSGDYECGHNYDAVEYQTVALYDMDGNEVPELLIGNGVNGRDQRATYVFTFADGRIRFCGNAGSDLKIGPSEYPGLFRSLWLSGYYMPSEYAADFSEDTSIRYYTLDGNEIKPVDVVHHLVDFAGNKTDDIVTDDKGLYEVSLAYDSMKSIDFVPMKQLLDRGWNKKYVKLTTRFASEDDVGDSFYGNYTYADVICCDLFGSSFWTYTTARYPSTELSPVKYIGANENCHFLFEGGYVTCLDEEDGVVLWSTQCAEDGGSPAVCIDEVGTIYEIGYYGHTLSVIDKNGYLYGSYTFPNDRYWPTEISVDDDSISVRFSDGNWPDTLTISMSDITCSGDPNRARTRAVKFDNSTTVDLNWGWELFNKDASEYSHDLAMAGCILSQAAEMGESEAEKRLNALGFENASSVYYRGNEDNMNMPATTFASAKISLNGEQKVLVAIVSRGSADIGDWLTNFYSVFNGFYGAADNVRNNFKSYYAGLSEFYGFDVNADNTILYITGHSLAGAVAGQLAQMTEGMFAKRNNIFTYTFASPNYETFKYDRESFTNVHNIINTQDAVPNLPWGYKRYGHDWYYDGKGNNIVDQHLLGTYLNSLLSGVPKNIGSGAVSTYSLSSIHCPVDIQVLDADGNLIAWTEESSVHYTSEPTLVVLTQDEAKYIYAPESVEYSIVFVGTGSGKMNYTQQTIDTYSQDVVSEKSFENIEIAESKIMCCDIPGKVTAEETKLYVVNSSGKAEKLIAEDGAEKSPFISAIKHSIGYVLITFAGIALLVCDIVLFRKKKQKRSVSVKL